MSTFTLTADGREVKISPRLPEAVFEGLRVALSYTPTGAEFAPNHHSQQWRTGADGKRKFNAAAKWDGRVSLLKKGRSNQPHAFPIGLIDRVKVYLSRFEGYSFNYVKTVEAIDPTDDTLHGKNVVLKGEPITIEIRDYQGEFVEALLLGTHSMGELATGGGKSIVIGELLVKFPTLRRLVTVPSKELMHQTAADLEAMLGVPVGRLGDGIHKVENVTVAVINSVASALGEKGREKRPEIAAWIEGVQMWICDESHLSASDQYKAADEAMNLTQRRYGVSATLIREDGAEMIFHGMFGPIMMSISAWELIQKGWLIKPRIEVHVVQHDYTHDGANGKKKPKFDDVYAADITYNLERNMLIAAQAKRCLDERRWPVLILISDLAHGQNIQDLVAQYGRTGYLQGEDDHKTRAAVVKALKQGELPFLVASTIFDVGIDIPPLRSVILAGSGQAQSRIKQRVGRGLRPDWHSVLNQIVGPKEEVLVIDFEDREKFFLRDHSLQRQSYFQEAFPGCVSVWKDGKKLKSFDDLF